MQSERLDAGCNYHPCSGQPFLLRIKRNEVMAWSDTPIEKPYTLKNFADLLSQGLLGSMSRFSHFQIVEWCCHFVEEYDVFKTFEMENSIYGNIENQSSDSR